MALKGPHLTWAMLNDPEKIKAFTREAFEKNKQFILLFMSQKIVTPEVIMAYKDTATLPRHYISMILLHILDDQAAFLEKDLEAAVRFVRYYAKLLNRFIECFCDKISSLEYVLAPYEFMKDSRPDIADYLVQYLVELAGEKPSPGNALMLANHWHAYRRKDKAFLGSLYRAFKLKGDVLDQFEKRLSQTDLELAFSRLDFVELVGHGSAEARKDKLARDLDL
jgi:hypothetical protein